MQLQMPECGRASYVAIHRRAVVPRRYSFTSTDIEGGLFAVQILVHPHELTECDWRLRALRGVERIHTQRVCQADDDDCEAQGIQPRFEEPELIRQRRERSAV